MRICDKCGGIKNGEPQLGEIKCCCELAPMTGSNNMKDKIKEIVEKHAITVAKRFEPTFTWDSFSDAFRDGISSLIESAISEATEELQKKLNQTLVYSTDSIIQLQSKLKLAQDSSDNFYNQGLKFQRQAINLQSQLDTMRKALEKIARNMTPMSCDEQAREWMAMTARQALSNTIPERKCDACGGNHENADCPELTAIVREKGLKPNDDSELLDWLEKKFRPQTNTHQAYMDMIVFKWCDEKNLRDAIRTAMRKEKG